jgi:hypothetical protein
MASKSGTSDVPTKAVDTPTRDGKWLRGHEWAEAAVKEDEDRFESKVKVVE